MKFKRILTVLLVFCMVFAFAACGKKEAAPVAPAEQTQPAETKPEETKPAETTPDETKPADTTPAETKPEEPKPAETAPEETKPVEIKPEETKPAETKQEETKPAETKPEETKPVEPVPETPKTEEKQENTPTPAENTVPEKLADGVYKVDVKTDGGSFKITETHNGKGLLYVSGEKMTADIVLSGTGESAVFNVSSIGSEFAVTTAVGSGAWDGHKVTVSNPEKISTKSITQITLTGGTGKSTVKTAEVFTDLNGKNMAIVTWSSKSLDWMEVDGVQYSLISSGGNCKFVIPVELGKDMAVSVQTSAMSTPHVIEYTLNLAE